MALTAGRRSQLRHTAVASAMIQRRMMMAIDTLFALVDRFRDTKVGLSLELHYLRRIL